MNTTSKTKLKKWYSVCHSSKQESTGFTLIELLVVISTTALLAVMLLPALAGPRADSEAFQCQNNVKQLTLGWLMYANDNNETLMFAGNWINASSGTYNYENWIPGPNNSNPSLMFDPGPNKDSALMAPYVHSPASFKCPADTFDLAGVPRVRTYSLDIALGGNASYGSAYTPDGNPRTYFSARKMTDLNLPGPANIYAFLDEHPDSIDDGQYALNAGLYSAGVRTEHWRNYPGSFHGRGVSIAFADGHSIIHTWVDSTTLQGVQFRSFSATSPINSSTILFQARDYEWLEDRMPYHY